MKLYKLLPALALAGLAGCSSDYLDDVERPLITQEQKDQMAADPEAKPRLIRAELESVYKLFITQDLNGNTAHDYFGLKAIHLATDLMGNDMVQTKHHHFGFDYRLDNREAPYRRTRLLWAFFYKIIASSNDFITKYLSDESQMTDELAAVKAELLTLRGISYFHLVNYYQQTYKGNEDALGVPLALPGSGEKLPRAKVSEVYKQIIADLTYGVEKGSNTSSHQDADRRVAAAYLAKAYAAMEDWANVEKYAQIAFDGISEALPTNFSKVDNDDVLWGYDINEQTSTIYASFFSHMDSTIPGYAGAIGAFKAVHNKFYDLIPTTDVRKTWWAAPGSTDAENYAEYANLKFKSPSDFTGDYLFIRAADPYLLYVEALAEQKKTDAAIAALNSFLIPRGVAQEIESHKDNLIDFIRLQRRIELWGEGSSYFDNKRWKIGVNRNIAGTNHTFKGVFAAGAPEFVYQIPQGEIDSNKNLEQNP